ncbi:Guanine nucleotide exchange factor (GEF) which may activate RAB8A and RAB8B [Mortierella polycephala]|uniref:Guanine nucleotide exchange factor (GEF) which may activate RAB8A and RAB8B n=1 Tax=Mortierella polycephala TaxID=41804 RepID=A0A9P6PQP0_9FUNG|nr:Guanine nucleotide exchange factor (GEF) which may activate RAB8A and RAB8B [Mortierella polycephala]
MTEAPMHPAPEPVSKDVTAKDIANLYSRIHNLIETVKEPQQKASAALSVPTPTDPTTTIKQDSVATTPKEQGEVVLIDGECACHKVCSNIASRACSLCDRIIPALAEAHNEHTLLLEDIEQTNVHLAEEQKRASAEAIEAEILRKKVEDLEDALDAKTDDYLSAQRDLAILNDKYVDEIEKVAELQHAKEMVEGELEELSRTLFEEANGMVASEARARHQLELTRKHLELELKDAQERLAAETSQLKELKTKMEAMMDTQPQSKRSSSDPSSRASVDLAQLFGLNKLSVPEPVAEEPGTAIAIDGHLMHEFKEFVAQSSTVRLAKIHSLPFMRHCQDEDVEPCLRFGSNPRIPARKLTEGICSNTCYIEETTAEQVKEYERLVLAAQQPPSPARNSMTNKNMLWERLQTQYALYQAPKGGCQTCGRPGPLTHRYRLATSDEWNFIDRFCRDRIVAACEFYIFIRNIRAGLYSTRTIEDLYSESLRLRLQMFYARAGVLPIMLSELGVASQSIGNMGPSGEWPAGTHPHAEGSVDGDEGSASPKVSLEAEDVVADESTSQAVEETKTTIEVATATAVEETTVSSVNASSTSAGTEAANPWTTEEKSSSTPAL